MLRDTPAAPVTLAGVMVPRDYQLRADAAIDEALTRTRSTLAVLATGTGKTVLFAMQARKRGGALVIAHEESLIDQAAQKLRHITGQDVAIEKAERKAWDGAKFIVASMQTLRGDRLRFFAQQHASIPFVVIDEAHRSVAKSYRDIMAAFPDAKVLGVTATADRGDKKALALVFEKANDDHGAAFKYDIADACGEGWLVLGDEWQMNVDGVTLDDVRIKSGDLDQDQLDAQLVLQAGQIAKAIVQHCKGERTLVFTPGVQTAIVGAEAINRLEPGAARSIHGAMPAHEKKDIKAAHSRGDFPYLLNCQILIEGYDDPRLANIVMLSKTKSRARFAQIYGRGTRPWPLTVDGLVSIEERRAAIAASPKPRWKFFDANYGRHGHTLAGATDLLGGLYDEDVKERAKADLAESGGGDVEAALKKAAAEVAAELKVKLARLAAKAAAAKGRVLVGPARSACELFGVSQDMGTEEEHMGEPGAQVVAWLVEKGIKNADKMPASAARALKAKLVERKRLGFGSFKQVRALLKAGVPNAPSLTGAQCGRLMEVVASHYHVKDWGFRFAAGHAEMLLGREPGQEG